MQDNALEPRTEVTSPEKPRAGIVVPRTLKWYNRVLAAFVYGAIELVAFTLRLRWDPGANSDKLASDQQAIFCVWHNRLTLSLVVYRDYVCGNRRTPRLAAIVSASKDGAIVARILEHFKVQPVRGSSSRRGAQALVELNGLAQRGYDIAFTPDGPRGPRYIVQSGIISLAQVTGLPIAPVSYHTRWSISAKSWDRFKIPLPFSRGVLRMGPLIKIPREASEEERESIRQQLEKALRDITTD